MTASAPIKRRFAARPAGRSVLRGATWGLHVTVSVLAVFSLFCNGFQWWVDLRMLGSGGTALTKILWAATVLVVPWCAGPRLTGLRKPAWSNAGWSAEWARRLLWPTYFLMACLAANSVYYYQLVRLDHID